VEIDSSPMNFHLESIYFIGKKKIPVGMRHWSKLFSWKQGFFFSSSSPFDPYFVFCLSKTLHVGTRKCDCYK